MKLTAAQIRTLEQQERDMDSGKLPFVILDGERLPVVSRYMQAMNLRCGQSINGETFAALIETMQTDLAATISTTGYAATDRAASLFH